MGSFKRCERLGKATMQVGNQVYFYQLSTDTLASHRMSTNEIVKSSTFTFGNFLVKIELDASVVANAVPESLLGYILDGCTQRLQRKPASAVEKALAGYEKRPTAFKRDSIAFSAKGVSLLEAGMGEAIADVATVSVTEYVPNTTEAKYGYERAQLRESLAMPGKTIEAIAERAKFTGEVFDEEGFDGYSTEFLQAVRALLKSAL